VIGMKVLFLSTWNPYPPNNGSKIRAYYLLRAISAQHETLALAFCPPTEAHSLDDSLSRDSVVCVDDDPFRYINAPRWMRYLSPMPLIFRSSHAMQQMIEKLEKQTWDVVVAVQMPVARYAGSIRATAKIIDVDTALTYQMRERYLVQRGWLRKIGAWVSWQKAHRYERKMLQKFQVATVVAQHEVAPLQLMTARGSCCVYQVQNGVDCERNHLILERNQDCNLVFNGSLTYSANYDAVRWFLAEIYPLIQARRADANLIVTGSTSGVDLDDLLLDECVHLTGYVEDVRVPVSEAAVAIAPIRQGGGTRLKILEAMALGTPVVATRKGAEGLDVIDGEHLLLADDPQSFANAVLVLLGDANIRARLAQNARRLVETHYDWAAIGDQFVQLVEDAVGAQRGAPVGRRTLDG